MKHSIIRHGPANRHVMARAAQIADYGCVNLLIARIKYWVVCQCEKTAKASGRCERRIDKNAAEW